MFKWRYEWSYLEFVELNGKEILSVKVISDLKIQGGNGMERRVAPAAVSAIVARLPHVKGAQASLFDNQKDDPSLRQGMRDGKGDCCLSAIYPASWYVVFARTLLPQWPASVKHLELYYRGDAPLNENYPPVTHSQKGEDSLSIALNRFT